MLEALKRYIGGILKFIWTKGNASLFATAQELLVLYNMIAFYELMQKDADEDEKIEDNFFLAASILASLPLILSNFYMAFQAIENTTRQVASYIPMIDYHGESNTPVDVMRSRIFRFPVGFAGSLSWSALTATTLMLLYESRVHEKVVDWVFGLSTAFLDETPPYVWIPLLALGTLASLPSEFFMRAGDLIERQRSDVRRFFHALRHPSKTKEDIHLWLYQNDLVSNGPLPPDGFGNGYTLTEYDEDEPKHPLIRFIQYVVAHTRVPLVDIAPYLYPILQLINDVHIDDRIKIGIGIALFPGFFAAAVNAWLTHAEAAEHFFKLEPNKWFYRVRKTIQLITAPANIVLPTTAVMIATWRLLEEKWGLDQVVERLTGDFELPSPTIALMVVLGVGIAVTQTALSTMPVSRVRKISDASYDDEEIHRLIESDGEPKYETFWDDENYPKRIEKGEGISSPQKN